MIHKSTPVAVGPVPVGPVPVRAGIGTTRSALPTGIVCGLLLAVTILAVSLLSTIGW